MELVDNGLPKQELTKEEQHEVQKAGIRMAVLTGLGAAMGAVIGGAEGIVPGAAIGGALGTDLAKDTAKQVGREAVVVAKKVSESVSPAIKVGRQVIGDLGRTGETMVAASKELKSIASKKFEGVANAWTRVEGRRNIEILEKVNDVGRLERELSRVKRDWVIAQGEAIRGKVDPNDPNEMAVGLVDYLQARNVEVGNRTTSGIYDAIARDDKDQIVGILDDLKAELDAQSATNSKKFQTYDGEVWNKMKESWEK